MLTLDTLDKKKHHKCVFRWWVLKICKMCFMSFYKEPTKKNISSYTKIFEFCANKTFSCSTFTNLLCTIPFKRHSLQISSNTTAKFYYHVLINSRRRQQNSTSSAYRNQGRSMAWRYCQFSEAFWCRKFTQNLHVILSKENLFDWNRCLILLFKNFDICFEYKITDKNFILLDSRLRSSIYFKIG